MGVDLEDALAMTLIAIRTADLKVAPKAVLNVDLLHGTAIAMMTGMMTGMTTGEEMTGEETIAASETMTTT